MTSLEVGLAISLAATLAAIWYLAKYASKEHQLRLRKATDAFKLGGNQKIGDLSQLLGTFDALAKYDEITLLSSTSAQSSMDLIGRKDNQIDFIEFKKAGTGLTKSERKLKSYIESGQLKVAYKIVDVSWPEDVQIHNRQ